MTQLGKTLERPRPALPAAAAALLVTGALVGAAAIASLAPDFRLGEPPAAPVAPVTDRAAVIAQLQSEHLLRISTDWYRATPPAEKAQLMDRLNSEYLREIAGSW